MFTIFPCFTETVIWLRSIQYQIILLFELNRSLPDKGIDLICVSGINCILSWVSIANLSSAKITNSFSMNECLCSIFPFVRFKRTSLLSYFFTCVRTYDRYQEFSLSTDYVSSTIVWKWHDLILPLHFVYSLEYNWKVNSFLGWMFNWKCCKTLHTFGNIFLN